MPKKRNFLGGMQNYNAKTGEYESALVGGNGKPVEDADGDGKKHESRSGGSLNIPTKKVTQKQLNKEVTDMFKTREEAEKWLSEQKDMSKEDIAHARERIDKAFSNNKFNKFGKPQDDTFNEINEKRLNGSKPSYDEEEINELTKDMEITYDVEGEGFAQYKYNPYAMVVKHPKHYKTIILGARTKDEAKRLFAELILKNKRRR